MCPVSMKRTRSPYGTRQHFCQRCKMLPAGQSHVCIGIHAAGHRGTAKRTVSLMRLRDARAVSVLGSAAPGAIMQPLLNFAPIAGLLFEGQFRTAAVRAY